MTRLFAALTAVLVMGLVATTSEEPGSPSVLRTAGLEEETPDTGVVSRRVFEGPDAQFWGTGVSPDGRYLSMATTGVSVLDLLSGRERTLGAEGAVLMTSFSPDGAEIAYTTWLDGAYEIRVIGADGSNERPLWRGALSEGPGVLAVDVEGWPEVYGWTRDGDAVLAVIYSSPWLAHIALFPVDGSPRRVLYEPPSGKGPTFAALSPDGRFLALDENVEIRRPDRPLPQTDIFVVPLEGQRRPVAVAPSPGHEELLGWTDDGRLLLTGRRDLTQGVWAVTIENGRPVGEPTLVKGDLWGIRPIGMAGNTVFYGVATQHSQVHTVGLSIEGRRLTGPLVPVEPDLRSSDNPVWSPDGRRLAYHAQEIVNRSTERDIAVIRSATGQEAQEIDLEIDLERVVSTSREMSWVREDELYFRGKLLAERSDRGFAALDLGSGEARTLFMFSRTDVPMSGDAGGTPPHLAGCRFPEFRPDGLHAFCLRDGEEQFELVEVDLSDGTMEVIWAREAVRGEGSVSRYPSLSRDGSRLAFWEYRTDSDGVDAETWSLNVLSSRGGDPTVVFSTGLQGSRYPLRQPVDGEYRPNCSGAHKPLWTPDGAHLLIAIPETVEEGEAPGPGVCPLYLVPVTGGDPVRIGALPAHNDWTLAPDGTRLAVTAGEPHGEIWVLEGVER